MGTSQGLGVCESAGGGVPREDSLGWQRESVPAPAPSSSSRKWKDGWWGIGRGRWKQRGFRDAERGDGSAGPVRGWRKGETNCRGRQSQRYPSVQARGRELHGSTEQARSKQEFVAEAGRTRTEAKCSRK